MQEDYKHIYPLDPNRGIAWRQRLFAIWQNYKNGKPLNGDEKILGELMYFHEGLHNTWEFADLLGEYKYGYDDEEILNPLVHLMFDLAVVKQVTDDELEGVGKIYNRLRERGMDHLDAIHEIAEVYIVEFYEISPRRVPYSDERYLRELQKLFDENLSRPNG